MKSDPTAPDQLLERAGILLLNRGGYAAAAGLFTFLLEHRPLNTDAWYCLGNALLMIARRTRDPRCEALGMQCLLRSLRENPQNALAREIVEAVRAHPELLAASLDGCPPFTGSVAGIRREIGYRGRMLAEAVLAVPSWEERRRILLWLGGQEFEGVTEMLAAAAEEDSREEVRRSAILQLPERASQPEIQSCLARLVDAPGKELFRSTLSAALEAIPEPWAQSLKGKLDN